MKYHDTFDRLGNPVAKPEDKEGWIIVAGVIICIIVVALWLRN